MRKSRWWPVLAAAFMLTSCAQALQGKVEAAVDPALGPQTLAFQNGIYQTRGEALPLRDEDLIRVGVSEGLVLYRLRGGGGGAFADVLYVKSARGGFQALVRIQ